MQNFSVAFAPKKVDKKLILKNTTPKGIEFLVTNYDDIFATKCRRPKIFQNMDSVRCKNPSLKYQRFTPSDGKIKVFES